MRFLFFITITFLLFSCTPDESATPTFILKGKVNNIERDYLILEEQSDIERKEYLIKDTIFLDEKGQFEKQYNLSPHFYLLKISEKEVLPLILEEGQSLAIKIDDKDHSVKGSPSTEKYLAYEKFRASSLERLVKSVRKAITKEQAKANPSQVKIDSLGKLEISNYDQHLAELNSYLKEKVGASLALYPTSIRWKGEENLEMYNTFIVKLEEKYGNLRIIERLREKLTRLQQTSLGGIASNIEMKNLDDTSKNLKDIHKKYTIIEFWASWCGPCRRESPILNELYSKYKDQGFEIFAVSLDRNKNQWEKASQKDQRLYTNVSSLEGFKTPAAYDYAVTALPMNYVINEEMEIIAKDIHGDALKELIDSLFNP
ncbi:hypothetical protein CW751_11235 [Brumimicrobium salinarum]|uniref:Thioredoxin domain-containing protein n=1 Tax=Brumimicrobium salinarum TaxID=2058658 RepID=A0A2I0R0Y7_9FLAO|nr:TlpA disulfide reductase family protein [Brumimicrobium salinarum]PKR80227.1 hypothetical protein CW751_11235 [Brumimicrobium salinarum]